LGEVQPKTQIKTIKTFVVDTAAHVGAVETIPQHTSLWNASHSSHNRLDFAKHQANSTVSTTIRRLYSFFKNPWGIFPKPLSLKGVENGAQKEHK
jgi:hypothetical protein